jgi:tellurite methyltransferase
MSLRDQFGDIDIYLFDQLLRGRIRPGMRILDAGCGAGRNLVYLLREGYDVAAADQSANAVSSVRQLATKLGAMLPDDAFRVEPVEALSFDSSSVDVVISSAVLHFARDDGHFRAMLDAMWRTLEPGGLFFARLASSIGLPASAFTPLGNRRYTLPDGSERYLVDEDVLMNETERLGGILVDPLKTTVVQNARCMTTWVVSKR